MNNELINKTNEKPFTGIEVEVSINCIEENISKKFHSCTIELPLRDLQLAENMPKIVSWNLIDRIEKKVYEWIKV